MKLTRKIIRIQLIIAVSAFAFGYIRRLVLGDSYLEITLLHAEVSTYSNWFDLTIGELYGFLSSIFMYSSTPSSFMFKFLWGISTSILVSSIAMLAAYTYFLVKK